MNTLTAQVLIYQKTQKEEDFLPIYTTFEPKIRYMANKSIVLGLGVEDIYSEMIEGLLIALEKFDSSKGFEFSTYAYQYIKWAPSYLRTQMNANRRKVAICSISIFTKNPETEEEGMISLQSQFPTPDEALEHTELADLLWEGQNE